MTEDSMRALHIVGAFCGVIGAALGLLVIVMVHDARSMAKKTCKDSVTVVSTHRLESTIVCDRDDQSIEVGAGCPLGSRHLSLYAPWGGVVTTT